MTNYEISQQAVNLLLDQCFETYDTFKNFLLPADYSNVNNVLVCGMGGSNLSTHVVRSLVNTKVPVGIIRGYDLPAWVGHDTFILLSSYSGDTEETLSCGEQALKKGCKTAGLTTGGKLKEFCELNKLPLFHFQPKNNPGGMPRFALGYGVIAEILILLSAGIVNENPINSNVFKDKLDSIKSRSEIINNSSKGIAENLKDKALCVISGEHLGGNAKVLVNQLNETAKSIAFGSYLPEADHNLIEIFSDVHNFIEILLVFSDNYSERLKERFNITRKVIEKSGYKVHVFKPAGDKKLYEALETLLFSSYLSLNTAEIKKIDPLSIPSIDYIKKNI